MHGLIVLYSDLTYPPTPSLKGREFVLGYPSRPDIIADNMKQLHSLSKPIRTYAPLVLLLLVLLLVAWRPLTALNLHARAGAMIDTYRQDFVSEYSQYLYCQVPLLTELPQDPRLDQAAALLDQAAGIRAFKGQTQLLLGRVHCLSGDFNAAVKAFEAFQEVRPDSPLGRMEAGFAHLNLALKTADGEGHLAQARTKFESLGYTFDYFLAEADAAFQNEAFADAWIWYRIAALYQPLPEEAAERYELLGEVY